ncbi:MAG: hypothetical protein ACRDYA_02330 [Egibacteraceae bacterium]
MLVLDAGGVSRLAERSQGAGSPISAFRRNGPGRRWVPSVVLVECLRGHSGRDALTKRFLKTCDLADDLPVPLARRAAFLRAQAQRGSAVDAVVVALAEPGGVVLTSDLADVAALAAHAHGVAVEQA